MLNKKHIKFERRLIFILISLFTVLFVLSCAPAEKTVKKIERVKAKRPRVIKPQVFYREGTEAKVGSVAPTFVAPTIKGKTVSTTNTEGKVVLLNFWSIMCGPCIKEMPYLERLYEEFKGSGLELFSINTDQASLSKVSEFIDNRPFELSYHVLSDPDLVLTTVFTKWFVPVTILIDSKGIMRYNNTGFTKRDYEKYRKIIKNLLNERK